MTVTRHEGPLVTRTGRKRRRVSSWESRDFYGCASQPELRKTMLEVIYEYLPEQIAQVLVSSEILPTGGAVDVLDWLEVVHISIRRSLRAVQLYIKLGIDS